MLIEIHVVQRCGDELPEVARVNLFGERLYLVSVDEGFFAGVGVAGLGFFGDSVGVVELGGLTLILGIEGVAMAARGGGVFVGDFDVVDEDVAEVDGGGEAGTSNHLIVDEEHHMVGAGWQMDGGGKSIAVLSAAL